jgi:hypothetical protein
MILFDAALFPNSALVVNLGLAADQIGGPRIDQFGLFPNLPPKVQDCSVGNAKVPRHETLYFKRRKGVKANKQERNETDGEPKIRPVRLKGRHVGQRAVGEILIFARAVPEDEDEDHDGVRGNEAGGCEIDEPVEHFYGRVGRHEKGDAGDETDDGDAVDWDTRLGALEEEPGSLAIWNFWQKNAVSRVFSFTKGAGSALGRTSCQTIQRP